MDMVPAPWEAVDSARTPEGGELVLYRRAGEYMIRLDGLELMSSRAHGSEEALAAYACARLSAIERPNVLVGGLGMGYTLRATLDILPTDARVTVAELVPAVVRWNRGQLGLLAGHPLADPRVEVRVADVGRLLRRAVVRFDAVILDVDNGPVALTSAANASLYNQSGLAQARSALKPGGALAVWSASPDSAFARRLQSAGFQIEAHEVPARKAAGDPLHTIFIGRLTNLAPEV